MKLVSYRTDLLPRALGLYHDGNVLDLHEAGKRLNVDLPAAMMEYLPQSEAAALLAKKVNRAFVAGELDDLAAPESTVELLAPVPSPTSMRDGYAFRQHVATARRNRGVDMIPEFDQFPIFYFTNHNAVSGPGDLRVMPDHLHRLDFELECAVVVGKRGRNIAAKDAAGFIHGLCIMNDFSARQLQMEEMKLNLGPAKGKDFSTTLGPWLVTLDELEDRRVDTPAGPTWDLGMRAYHNGRLISEGNLKDMTWTFSEILERASYGVDLLPGDVIGSGTVGTGCYLELNGTRTLEAKERGESYTPVWLEAGDTIALEIDGLGRLENRIVAEDTDHSILALKKNASGGA